MQKKDQYGNLIPHQRKRGVFVFLSTIMLAGMFFISGNIKTTQAADSYTKLLLHADGTGNSFVDSSSGAKAINVSGYMLQVMLFPPLHIRQSLRLITDWQQSGGLDLIIVGN